MGTQINLLQDAFHSCVLPAYQLFPRGVRENKLAYAPLSQRHHPGDKPILSRLFSLQPLALVCLCDAHLTIIYKVTEIRLKSEARFGARGYDYFSKVNFH